MSLGQRRHPLSPLTSNARTEGAWNEEEEEELVACTLSVTGAFKINLTLASLVSREQIFTQDRGEGVVWRSYQAVGLMCLSTLDLAWHFEKSIFLRPHSGQRCRVRRAHSHGEGRISKSAMIADCVLAV